MRCVMLAQFQMQCEECGGTDIKKELVREVSAIKTKVMHQEKAFHHRGLVTNLQSFVENCSCRDKNKTVNLQSI